LVLLHRNGRFELNNFHIGKVIVRSTLKQPLHHQFQTLIHGLCMFCVLHFLLVLDLVDSRVYTVCYITFSVFCGSMFLFDHFYRVICLDLLIFQEDWDMKRNLWCDLINLLISVSYYYCRWLTVEIAKKSMYVCDGPIMLKRK
jgi:hypothetical protein